ncbi:fimbrial assembly protein [Halomonas sp. MCCC 1A17488]|uniref:Fimbrial assembly protein n=1 Tax=Billgrantia sulfidoxydans TaxID=2733484 RepID=A0ABX7VZH7_9GAMM|nr:MULTISPECIES: PilN domain-containing protein [Halomonas]MCE8016703.1 fimbrial assembly protein [Halomonas sp. MCCC 1A17488]MCG3240036.1 fimbrial assembly protein [Halomonas sp. MCCC 1A17488]QPP50080.1 PilN domain-containing protein [Halomonas sp. SS10-MC5]QTP53691.1 fimbrial assembly protein [Halomonas sulfidoxydans]
MTIEINLLAWREQQRARRSRRFYLALTVMALLGGAGGLGLTYHYDAALAAQRERNAHIQERMQQLDGDIRSIGEYEAIRERMIGQVQVFSDLQQGRSQTVRVFRDLTLSLVDGVHYLQMSRQGDQLRLTGRAESNHRVSEQMRALAAAPAFSEPVLSEVESDGGARRRFSLGVTQLMEGMPPPGDEEEGEP